MKGIQVRKGAVLLWRLGQLSYGEQSTWDRAPLKKGMWAFPWPYYDQNFTEHQYNYYMPKHLKEGLWGDPVDPQAYAYPDGSKPTGAALARLARELEEYGYPESGEFSPRAGFTADRRAWIENVGKKVLPLRKFWYEGELLTHIPKNGTDSDGWWDILEDWHRVDSSEIAPRLKKAAGQLARGKAPARIPRSDCGPLELFLPPRGGKIS